jgi:hypothetical protein
MAFLLAFAASLRRVFHAVERMRLPEPPAQALASASAVPA